MEFLKIFPHLTAALNTAASIFLIFGLYFVLSGRLHKHRIAMLCAATLSVLFLISYLSHHTLRTYYFGLGPTRFTGEGIARPIYFTILTSHTILAAAVAPLVLLTLYRALRGNFAKHKRIARWTYPVWLYVSITGVAVYIMLYHLYPGR